MQKQEKSAFIYTLLKHLFSTNYTTYINLILVIFETEAPINPLTPNDLYMSRTAPLTCKRCIVYIYSTNMGTEYFKHALYSPLFLFKMQFVFLMLTCLVPVLFTFYIQGVLKLKKNNSGAKGLRHLGLGCDEARLLS